MLLPVPTPTLPLVVKPPLEIIVPSNNPFPATANFAPGVVVPTPIFPLERVAPAPSIPVSVDKIADVETVSESCGSSVDVIANNNAVVTLC